MPKPLIVLDNGASTIKVGVVNEHPDPLIIPNAIVRSKGDKKTYFGHEIAQCKDYSTLHFRLPFEKGYLVDWDAQKAVWDGVFSDQVLAIDTTQSSLLITEPYFNLPNIQDVYDQMIFEEYEFAAYYRSTPASFMSYGQLFSSPGLPSPQCCVVVDSGFSFTHVVPMINGEIIWKAVKRLDVGGKLLSNHLKELVSFRQWNMMDETYIMNQVKEACCFVTSNYNADTETCRVDPKQNSIVQEYILPDLSTNRLGRVRQQGENVTDTDQILIMNNERFTVPELLFRPDDIGLDQAGLASTIAYSISLLPNDLQGMFWANIGLIGGNTKFPGLRGRLLAELRMLAPVDCEVVIYEGEDPIIEAYQSAYAFARSSDSMMTSASGGGVGSRFVTRAEYLESGSLASRKKFLDWKSAEDLERAVYEKISGKSDQDGDVLSHKEKERADLGGPATTSKERDVRKDGSAGTGLKGSGRTRARRDEMQRQMPRVDDPSSQVENPSSGRITRTRSARAGMASTPK